MSTDYHQVPSQHAFFTAASREADHMDPWVITANSVDWGKAGTRHMVPLFEEEGTSPPPPSSWGSNPSSPIYLGALKNGAASPTSFSLNPHDAWAQHHQQDSEEDEEGEENADGSTGSGDDNGALNLYKTELCRSFVETGTCRYGLKCQFAHGHNELRPVHRHPKYKTEICKTFHTQGTCPYGTRCRFIHIAPGAPLPTSAPSSRNSSRRASPSTSPYSSPPMTAAHSRSPSPPSAFASNKWASSWPQNTPPAPIKLDEPSPVPVVHNSAPIAITAEREEEGDGANESTDDPSPSKKRLAIFRTISKDNLRD